MIDCSEEGEKKTIFKRS